MPYTTSNEKIYHGYSKGGEEIVMVRTYQQLNNNPLQGQWGIYNLNTGVLLDNSPFRNDLIEKWFG